MDNAEIFQGEVGAFLASKVEEVAERTGRTTSEVVRDAIVAGLPEVARRREAETGRHHQKGGRA